MVKRIVRFDGPDGGRAYELVFESLAVFRPGKAVEAAAESALGKLVAIGAPKEATGNPDLTLMKLDGRVEVELLESERDVLLSAIDAIQFPTFALGKKRSAVALLMNAERVESA